jgi:hypothetical protein
MPAFFPEGNTSLPSDDELRSWSKYVQILFDANGNKPSPYPEGCAPLPSDDIMRLEQKAVILKGP